MLIDKVFPDILWEKSDIFIHSKIGKKDKSNIVTLVDDLFNIKV